MKHRISILFFLKSSKTDKNGLVPIYLRITINSERINLSTSKYVDKHKWNSISGKLKGNNEETRLINSHLETLRNKVFEIEKWMVYNNEEITAQTFKNKFLGIEEKERKLIVIFEEHNKRISQLIGKEYANNTMTTHPTYKIGFFLTFIILVIA